MRNLKKFILLAIDAPIDIRFNRAKSRGRLENAPDIIKFRELEEKEKSIEKTSQNIDQCMKEADFIIYNDGNVKELYIKIDNLIKGISE